MSEYQCPTCGSDNIQKISLAVMKGTKSVSLFGLGGSGAGPGGGGAMGTSQSALAEIHSPPTEKRIFWWCLGIFLFAPGAIATGNAFPIVIAVMCLAGLIRAWYYNNKEYPTELREWNSRWICQRCASVFKL